MKSRTKYLIRLYLASWLPVIVAFICALFILKQMKQDKDNIKRLETYTKVLENNNVALKVQVQQLKNNCGK